MRLSSDLALLLLVSGFQGPCLQQTLPTKGRHRLVLVCCGSMDNHK